MRASFLSLIAAFSIVFPYGTFANAQAGAPNAFMNNLSLGSSGPQVIALQRILNRDPDTRIASTGSGSPGNETSYFGALTKRAVVRFQAKYASEVLTPAGLSQGNGYVGLYTRAKLNTISTLSQTSAPRVDTQTVPAETPAPAMASQNPNLKNVDKFLAALDSVATKQGASATEIAAVKEQVMKVIATTTDLHATFLKMVQDTPNQAVQDTSLIGRTLAMVERAFDTVFMPGRARAGTGVPFGGALLFPLPCNGGVWNIMLSPLPPTFVTLVSYMSGSQAFLSYNIPATSWLLGEYTPGPGACWIGPYYIYSEGLITPVVGSSPV
ncbi:MAG: peptidoglycan-binding domain-containing protein [Candidatus Paceibacterota bacterium]|jgi:hypothetical protein